MSAAKNLPIDSEPGSLKCRISEYAHLNSCLAAGDGSCQAMHVALQRSLKTRKRAQALGLPAALPQALDDCGIQRRIRPSARLYHLIQNLQAHKTYQLCLHSFIVSLHRLTAEAPAGVQRLSQAATSSQHLWPVHLRTLYKAVDQTCKCGTRNMVHTACFLCEAGTMRTAQVRKALTDTQAASQARSSTCSARSQLPARWYAVASEVSVSASGRHRPSFMAA